jgi:hypothetical protein
MKSIEPVLDQLLYFNQSIVDVSTEEPINYDMDTICRLDTKLIESAVHSSDLCGLSKFGTPDGLTIGYVMANYIPVYTHRKSKIKINMLISGITYAHEFSLKLFMDKFQKTTKKTINTNISTFNTDLSHSSKLIGTSVRGLFGDGDCTNESNVISLKNDNPSRKLAIIFQDISPSGRSTLSAILTIVMMLEVSGFVCIRIDPMDKYVFTLASIFKEASVWSPPWTALSKIYFIGRGMKKIKKASLKKSLIGLLQIEHAPVKEISYPRLNYIEIKYLSFFKKYFI